MEGVFVNGNVLVGHDFTIDDENKIYFLSNEPLGNDDDIDEFWDTYKSFIRVIMIIFFAHFLYDNIIIW